MELYRDKKSNVWYYDHTPRGGKRVRRSTGKVDKYQARLVAKKKIEEMETRGVNVADNDFKQFVIDYWSIEGETMFRKRTILDRKNALNHLINYVDPQSVSSISVLQARKFQTSYLLTPKDEGGAGLKPVSANTVLRALRHIFKVAHDIGYCAENVWLKVPFLKYQEEDTRAMSKPEIDKFLVYVQWRCPQYYDLCYFYFLTGLRKGEAFRLEWRHIHFETKRIHIDWTKTKYNRRVLMLPVVIDMLRRRKEAGEKKPFVHSPTNFRKMIERIRIEEDLDMPWLQIKMFRRSASTYLRVIGVPSIVVDQIMGHTEEVALHDYFDPEAEKILDLMAPLQDMLPSYTPPTPESMAELRQRDSGGKFSKRKIPQPVRG